MPVYQMIKQKCAKLVEENIIKCFVV